MFNLENARLHCEDILNNLVDNYNFSQVLDFLDEYTFNEWVRTQKELPFTFFSGMTKLVIWDGESDYVLKMPFCDRDFDYCRAEVRNYKKAVEAGFAEHFAYCELLMNFSHAEKEIPVYIMEYVEMDEWENEKAIDSYLSTNCSLEDYDPDCDGEDKIIIYIENIWEKEKVDAFSAFCRENRINDLHPGNVGFQEGEPIFIDYSGFGFIERAKNDPDWWKD